MLCKKDYEPISGFFDLRNFELTSVEFRQAWRIQLFLSRTGSRKEYYKKHDQRSWQQAINISAELQMFLLLRLRPGAELA